MERMTISVSDELAGELTAFMASEGYTNRSEAIRDLARLGLARARGAGVIGGDCVATLSYVYDHHSRDLPKRLTDAQHAHHGLHVATLHVHLDPDSCLEVAVLKGEAGAVKAHANAMIAERGVTHGQVSLIPVANDAPSRRRGAQRREPARAHNGDQAMHPIATSR